MNKKKLSLILPAAVLLAACANNTSFSSSSSLSSSNISSSSIPSSSSEIISSSSETSSSTSIDPTPEIFRGTDLAQTETMPESMAEFSPSLFKASTLSSESKGSLGDGVNHLLYSFNLTSGRKVEANVIEVDLSKAEINTNNSSTIDTVNNQIIDFEAKTDKKVMAGVNADFFATGTGGSSVNAYVNNKNIIKASHNDRGGYDYKNLDNDIPASKPMLFGTAGGKARIAPIIQNGTIEETIKSSFTYSLYTGTDQAKLDGSIVFNKNKVGTYDFDLVTKGLTYISGEDELAIKVKTINNDNSSFIYGQIEEITELMGERITTGDDIDNGYFYVFTSSTNASKFNENDYVGYCVTCSDGTWNGYKNIIGGRQSLVENGEIASTVKLENSNGAQSTDTPRTSVGIKTDGKVLVCAIEALRYGGVSSSSSDPYGVNLPELAEFMRYIGCYDAMNFDGGGSTQLIVSANNGEDPNSMAIRCSDYGTTGVNDARKVYNTLLVTTK